MESVYEEVLCYELERWGIECKRQIGIPVLYDNVRLNLGLRSDVIVENLVIVEIKSIDSMAPVFAKQILTYLKLTDKKLGLLVNFNVNLIKEGK